MTTFIIITAVANLALGFGLAVYLGAAPRYAHPHVPVLREGIREPSPLVRRLMHLVPFRRRSA